jgi:hypothetical protein
LIAATRNVYVDAGNGTANVWDVVVSVCGAGDTDVQSTLFVEYWRS